MFRKSILFLALISLTFSVIGNPVDSNFVKTIAKNLYWERSNNNVDYNAISTTIASIKEINNIVIYYVVEINPSGYVIVSGDDNAYPILAYSLNNNYVSDNQPEQYISWMQNYEMQIQYIINNNLQADQNIIDSWNYYSIHQINSSPLMAVTPLLNTTWDQDDYYNTNCPSASTGPGGHVYAGCVATAMAQVMKFWSYPTQGTGTHSYSHTVANGYSNNYGTLSANFGTTTYGWSNMPNSLTSSSTSTQKAAIAQLIYHCGVSVEMDYDVSGSAASTADCEYSLKTYFNYNSSADYKSKSSYTTTSWDALIKSDLDNGYPIIYRGDGTAGGHSFVLDGYQGTSNNHYHFNWGWSGYNNGYFYLTSLNPGTYNFTSNQGAVFQIHPASSSGLNCSGAYSLTSGTAYNGTTIGGNSNVSTYSGAPSSWTETGPEKVHTISISGTTSLSASLTNLGTNDLDVFILSSCNNNACVAFGDNTASLTNATSGTYYIVVDGYGGASGSYTLTVSVGGSPNLSYYTNTGSVNTFSYDTTTHVLGVTNSVANYGTGPAGGFRIGWYLSTDTTITTSDVFVDSTSMASLANGYFSNQSISKDLDSVSGLSSGIYYVGVIFDFLSDVSETNENDNSIYFTNTINYSASLGALNCSGAPTLTSGTPYNGTTIGGNSNVTTYTGVPWNESGPEKVHKIITGATGNITATLTNLGSNDLDVVILSACSEDSVVTAGDLTCTSTSVAAGIYYIVVDGYNGASGSYTLTVTFTGAPTCTYTLSPTSQSIGFNGGSGTFNVITQTGCTWTATESCNWVTIDPAWTVQVNHSIVGDIGGSAGVETDGTYYYVAQWSGDTIAKYNMSGTLLSKFTITGVTGLRDLAYDGTYFYGGKNTNLIYKMNFNSSPPSLVSTITCPSTFTIRNICYQPDSNAFWVGGWATDLSLVNMSGTVLRTIPSTAHGLTSTYGTAYDTVSAGGPYIWAINANSTTNTTLTQINAYSGLPTGLTHDCTMDVCSIGELGGGLWIQPNIVSNTVTLGGIIQGVKIFGYDLATATNYGNGSGIVNFNVDTNLTTSQRTCNITAGGQTFAITQSGATGCTYSLSSNSQSFTSSSGTGTFNVITQTACTWTATESCSWVTITSGSSGTGNGTVNYSITANTGTTQRTCTISVQGQNYIITQAPPCSYILSPSSLSFTAAGGTGTFSVQTQTGCTWTATESCSFVTITSGSSGTGNGSVSYTVSANSSTSPRSCIITVQGQSYTITQSGNCTFTLSSTGQNFTHTGGTGSFTITTSTGCSWTATESCSWLTITSPASGSGNGSITFSVTPNTTTAQRNCVITVESETYTVVQTGAPCTYTLSPTSQNFTFAGGNSFFNVQTLTGCTWTATESCSWVSITSGSSGSGNGVVNFSIDPNTSSSQRSCSIDVQGQSFSITQDAGGLAPIADFVASQTSGIAPITVDFIDNSTNTPTSWDWTFYGGTPASSTIQNPINIIYSTPGSFAVKLTATNAFGSDSETKGSYINVSPSGVVEISNTQNIFVYPNPTHDMLYIDSKTKIGIVEITNMLGEIVYKGIYSNKIDISNLSNGIYTMSIFDESSKLVKREKVVKY
ncbi:MAG: C10 family peptidase [Saprospiraceae bacterium]|nr:C10 family peptidase [Saprospiraceae bacterium]